ncbi:MULTISPECIES: hypothetical protein [Neobacillus]|jgi:hypothetical protein|uniref:hypothetical protein n=1 Tax=Neobacillus TaxID=2675232 RepID=UPI000BF41E1F|nr:hypothetical protein [Neobacillus sp. OS1-33]PEQ93669.1 hypothetical protein CN481_08425 [Bacillus sp. AFS006103]WML27611.1 hypothetical protein RCG22_08370 [Neobacillus sp. OS1-33]
MKSVQDTLYNWLTIKVVCDARPDDTAAKDTLMLFEEMIADLHLSNLVVTKDDLMYYVSYQQGEETKKARFPQELIDIMLKQINQDPKKYENYPIEEE